MQIKEIFAKNLFRPINGVVKADQRDEDVVWQELEEYVVTKELDRHFRDFFDAFVYTKKNSKNSMSAADIGVWIAGFFGSGKSHFLKILSYLLQNIQARNPETGEVRQALNFFEEKIQDPMLMADIKLATSMSIDTVLFNIDSRADADDGRGAVLKVFWRVFNEMQGFSGGALHIAEMERYLTDQGKHEEFCRVYKEVTGSDWHDERDAFGFKRDQIIQSMSRVLDQSMKSAEQWFDQAQQNMVVTVENFARQVCSYIEKKGDNHRVVFLVDEVGQFIGTDGNLMLNLQTIAEDLGRLCQDRAWVVVTSQEDIDYILGDLKSSKTNDFSKIQDRFKTRISLSSSNTDEVINARLLEKTPEAESLLKDIFRAKRDVLLSQLSFSEDSASLVSYNSSREFTACYPFAGFHFKLIQKVFESIRKVGASGMHMSRGERSMLDAFQSAAKNVCQYDTGRLVPLYEFYPAIESFLDTSVKKTIDQAQDNPGLENPFDLHLLQTLFLIRYVNIMKPKAENLVTLFIDQVDADRLAIKREIEAGLQRLEKQTLISRNGDLYFFLTNEERVITDGIKRMEVSSTEETRLLSEVVFKEILKDQKEHRYKPYKRDYGFNRFLDGHPLGSKLDQELSLAVLTPLSDEHIALGETGMLAHTAQNSGSIMIKLGSDSGLEREVRLYLQTEKYVHKNMDLSLPAETKRILRDKQDENRDRKSRIAGLLEELILRADCYALGQTLNIKAANPRGAVEEALEHVIQNLYNKFSYLSSLSDNPLQEIKAVVMASDSARENVRESLNSVNKNVIREVREYIDLMSGRNSPVLLGDLARHFGRRPYGWPEWETVLAVSRLHAAGELNFFADGDSLVQREALEFLSKTNRWNSVKIIKRKVPSADEIAKARKTGQEVFGKIGPDSADSLEAFLRQELDQWQKSLARYHQLARTGDYPGLQEIDDCLKLIRKLLGINDTFEFIQAVNREKDSLNDASDDIHTLNDFYTNQITAWESLRKSISYFSRNEAVLEKNEQSAPDLKRLHLIAQSPAPYNMLKEVAPLVSRITLVNDQLLQEHKQAAVNRVDPEIESIRKELESAPADSDFSNKVLYPLQQIKAQIEQETSIPNISYLLERFSSSFDDALDQIEEHKHKETPVNGEKGKPDKVRTVRSFKAASVATKPYLDNEQDVEVFVQAMRQKLLDELKGNVRIRIQ
ncbi:BREX system P-loop protein BrxC [Desulfonatronovibrio magnus]|uniref:BREX system P-loop protein BrxC n=1 Tax=Desulfonatronovibrio magnus TaxID=698827 RepID=UPI0005EB73F2|nr:BREX system P-loop protein BrxC [Desulfonatronovibrio magnus]